MKNRNPNQSGNGDRRMMGGPKPMTVKKKKSMNRLGGTGTGLSLQAFANAKSTNNNYNPALLKKKREFYKNVKYVNKYKKSLKQQNQGNNGLPSSSRTPEDENEEINGWTNKMKNTKKKNGSLTLKEVYKKQWEEKEKAMIEREAAIQAKKEQREKAEAQRKVERKEMFKKTRHGQPIMKYRIHTEFI
ncbi:uncharacterized protein LOC120135295 [Hibiscus syriacus]|uniref:uncharacterized protein LOC120135295 n=1 Tax=Hibiscus syriacus TaxID=106335 RepID=UPI00192202EE|nr:uncharacterized protein LOC120135295 [Hibiscus syriacus]